MKRVFCLVLLTVAVALAVGAQDVIKIGYFEIAPYAIGQAGGKAPIGASVDYWTNVVAPAMNVKVQWIGPTPMLRLLKQLESGDLDAVLVLGKNPAREKLYLYPSTPYVHFKPALAVLKENPLVAIKTQDDVAGMKVGTAEGAVVADFMKTAKVTWDNVTSANWIGDSYVKLQNKRIDAVFNLGIDALQFEAAQAYAGKFKFLLLPVPPADIFTGFARSARGEAFMKKYDPINSKNATQMDTLLKKYILQ
jgi:ABC-type amino acid transport substrate-binding protein